MKGMSRDDDRVIVWTGVASGMVSATGAERLSLDFQPVTKTGAALFLLGAANPRSRRYASAQIRPCVTAGFAKGVGPSSGGGITPLPVRDPISDRKSVV